MVWCCIINLPWEKFYLIVVLFLNPISHGDKEFRSTASFN